MLPGHHHHHRYRRALNSRANPTTLCPSHRATCTKRTDSEPRRVEKVNVVVAST